MIRTLVADGTTVLLTTQYLEEADRLADEIVVIDHGKVIAAGTPQQLKTRVGGLVLQAQPDGPGRPPGGREDPVGVRRRRRGRLQRRTARHGPDRGPRGDRLAFRRLEEAGVAVDDLSLRRPSLDEVFLAVTGHVAEEERSDEDEDEVTRRRASTKGRWHERRHHRSGGAATS